MKLVCISDMHSLKMKEEIPKGDILVVAGDFCNTGTTYDVMNFNFFLKKLPHNTKIVIAGNHDMLFEKNPLLAQSMLNDCHYLQDSEVVINGIRFYGTPWQPEFFNWAFNLPRGNALKEKWDKIPEDVDVLITHSPPYGILDQITPNKEHLGCKDLWIAVQRIQPRLHIFGHIHGGYGRLEHDWGNGNKTIFINAAICTERYKPTRKPQVVELI